MLQNAGDRETWREMMALTIVRCAYGVRMKDGKELHKNNTEGGFV